MLQGPERSKRSGINGSLSEVCVVSMVAVVRTGDADRPEPELQDVKHGPGRQVILVSGSPGAGKSTLAAPLAKALGFPLLSKDVIKETLFDSIGDFHHDIVATSDALDPAAMSLLWRLAADSLQVVMEANFKPGTDHEANIRSLSDRPVEIYCRVAPEVAFTRYNQRGQRPDRHRVHYTRKTSYELLGQYQEPLRLGPVIEIDTTQTVDVLNLTNRVRSVLRDH